MVQVKWSTNHHYWWLSIKIISLPKYCVKTTIVDPSMSLQYYYSLDQECCDIWSPPYRPPHVVEGFTMVVLIIRTPGHSSLGVTSTLQQRPGSVPGINQATTVGWLHLPPVSPARPPGVWKAVVCCYMHKSSTVALKLSACIPVNQWLLNNRTLYCTRSYYSCVPPSVSKQRSRV